ncbi:MAG: DUF2845 domain-containing protein [Woeseiaceae bacterium]|nr:DUF2845 domain-containing protein [Woeseiaceae bacterium]
MVLVNLDFDMIVIKHKLLLASVLLAVVLLPERAAAFRCGNKLVKEGMHTTEVIAICGEPTSVRHLGYAIRSVDIRDRRRATPGLTITHGPGYYAYPVEVMVTEYIYNLGPRKFMRRVLFEDGLVASIETLGRGYRE